MKQSVVVVLALIGIILGVVGTSVGLSAKKSQDALLQRVIEVEGKMDVLKQDNEAALNGMWNNVQNSLMTLTTEMATVQQALVDMTNKTTKATAKVEDSATTGGTSQSTGTATETPKKTNEKEAKPADGWYVVKAGDTVGSICARFGIKQHRLFEANKKLNPNKMHVGMKIRIP